MSKIALNAPASGTGVITLQAPVTNTDRTLNLPDADGTLAAASGGTPSAATFLRGDGQWATSGQYVGTAAVKAIAFNAQTIGENLTIASNQNGLSAGPIEITPGFIVTISPGGNWAIV